MVELALQLEWERKVDKVKDLRYGKAVVHAVSEFVSQGLREFLPKERRAWNEHLAAPALVVAGRNGVSYY